MLIEIHAFMVVVHGMTLKNIQWLCDKVLKVDFSSFKQYPPYSNTVKLTRAFKGVKESVHIRHNTSKSTGYTTINLHGSFFDCAQDFEFSKLLKYLNLPKYEYTPKQLDIAFNDTKRLISKETVVHWCNDSDDYCTGDLVARRAPEVVYCKRELSRIHLASASSTTNFGTIYFRPKTQRMRLEIKFKDADKIRYLLEDYSQENIQLFEEKCLKSLVSCINFVTPSSKRSRAPKRQRLWKLFLGSDVKRLNWSKLNEKRRVRRAASDASAFAKSMSRLGATVSNLVDRYKGEHSEEAIIKELSDLSGIDLGNKASTGKK